MMHQGNWTQPQIDGINPDLNLGILPAPIDNDPSKGGETRCGCRIKLVPAFKSIPSSDETTGDLGAEISRHVKEGKIWSWNFQRFPKGLNQDLSSSMQVYIAGGMGQFEV